MPRGKRIIKGSAPSEFYAERKSWEGTFGEEEHYISEDFIIRIMIDAKNENKN